MTKSAITDVIKRLHARLPELEWQLNQSAVVLNTQYLPSGLFRSQETWLPFTSKMCVDEIRLDLSKLQQILSDRADQFLAEKIMQKINIIP